MLHLNIHLCHDRCTKKWTLALNQWFLCWRLTLSLALTSAPQWMRCSAHLQCPVLTATWRGVLSSWRTDIMSVFSVLSGLGAIRNQLWWRGDCDQHSCIFKNCYKEAPKSFDEHFFFPWCQFDLLAWQQCRIHARQQQCIATAAAGQPHPQHVESPSTNLVPVGELGSLVQEELQGWKASSSAGPVDRCGFQLEHTFTQLTHSFLTGVFFLPWLFWSLTLSFLSIEAPASSSLFITSTWPWNEALCRAVLWNWTNETMYQKFLQFSHPFLYFFYYSSSFSMFFLFWKQSWKPDVNVSVFFNWPCDKLLTWLAWPLTLT